MLWQIAEIWCVHVIYQWSGGAWAGRALLKAVVVEGAREACKVCSSKCKAFCKFSCKGLQTCMQRVPDLTRSEFCHEVGWRRGVGRRRLGLPRTLTDPLRRGGALKGCLSGQNESAPCLSTESKIGDVCKFYKYSLRCSLLVAQICHFTARPLQVNLSTRCRLPV